MRAIRPQCQGFASITEQLEESTRVLAQRASAPGVVRPEVRERTAALSDAERTRADFAIRAAAMAWVPSPNTNTRLPVK